MLGLGLQTRRNVVLLCQLASCSLCQQGELERNWRTGSRTRTMLPAICFLFASYISPAHPNLTASPQPVSPQTRGYLPAGTLSSEAWIWATQACHLSSRTLHHWVQPPPQRPEFQFHGTPPPSFWVWIILAFFPFSPIYRGGSVWSYYLHKHLLTLTYLFSSPIPS